MHGEDKGEQLGYRIDSELYRHRFIEAMDDDFNTAQAIAILFDLARDINRADESGGNTTKAQAMLTGLTNVLGLTLEGAEMPPLEVQPFIELQESVITRVRKAKLDKLIDAVGLALENQDIKSEDVASHINWLRDIRTVLREAKQFRFADMIRAELDELDIALEDTPQGTVWKRKR